MPVLRLDGARRWRAWFTALVCALGSGVLVGCTALSGPPSEVRYVLASIAGVDLPATFFETRDVDGNVWTLEMVESHLTLFSDDTFMRSSTALRKLNGDVIEPLSSTTRGRIERRDGLIVVRYPSGGGYEDVVHYDVLDGGRQLAGPHATGAVYRWLRTD